jgi:hypothetical protein
MRYLTLLLLLLPIAHSLDCDYDPHPNLKLLDKLELSCNDAYGHCIAAVWQDGSLVSLSPTPETVRGVGVVDSYEARGGIVNIPVRTTDLYDGYNYTAIVLCGNGTVERWNATIAPVRMAVVEPVYRMAYMKDNMGFVIGWLVVASLAATVAWFIRQHT